MGRVTGPQGGVMTSIDLSILGILVLFAFSGFHAGIMNKFFSITGIVLALVLAVKYLGAAANIVVFLTAIRDGGGRSPMTYAVGFLAIFLIVVVAVKVVYFMITRERRDHSRFQRVSGSVAGFFEGGLFISVLLVWLNVIGFPTEYQKQQSLLYKPAIHIAPVLFDEITYGLPRSRSFYDEISKHFDVERVLKR